MKKIFTILALGWCLHSQAQIIRYPGGAGSADTTNIVPSLYKHRQDSITLRNLINTNSTAVTGKADKTTSLTVNSQTLDLSQNRTFSITALSLLPTPTGNGGKFVQVNSTENGFQYGGAMASNVVNQYFNGYGSPVTFSYDSIPATVQNKTAAYTVATGDNYVRVDATSGNLTMTLQAASAYVTNKRVRFKKIDAGTNTVTIAAGGSDTIDGAASYALTTANQGVELMRTASNKWDVVGKF